MFHQGRGEQCKSWAALTMVGGNPQTKSKISIPQLLSVGKYFLCFVVTELSHLRLYISGTERGKEKYPQEYLYSKSCIELHIAFY